MAAPLRPSAIWTRRPALVDLALLLVASLPVCWPLLLPGYLDTHDGLFHLFRLVDFDRVFRQGEWYPRLAPNLALGYDYPVFNYYSPLGLYLGEGFRLLGLGYIDAVKACYLVGVVSGGWAMWLWARDTLPRAGAVLAGLAYIYLPYLLVDIYVRGSLAEALALSWLPLCLWTLNRLATRPGVRSTGLAALAFGGLGLTHVVTTMLFMPVAVGWWPLALVRAREAARAGGGRLPLRRWLAVLPAAALVAGGTAFYWAPACFEREFVQTDRLVAAFFGYGEHFQPVARVVERSFAFDYGYDFLNNVLFRLGLVQVALAVAGLGVGLLASRALRREALFWAATLLVAAFLLTNRSRVIWDSVPLLGYAQFPWRLLADARLASAALIGLLGGAAPLLLGRLRGAGRLVLPAQAMVLVGVTAVLAASALLALRPAWLALAETEVQPWTIQRQEQDRKLFNATIGEYVPRWVELSPFEFTALPAGTPPAGPTSVGLLGYGPTYYRLVTTAADQAPIVFDRFYFPGWRATVDGRETATRPSGPLGLLTVEAPAGQHEVEVRFGDTPVRSVAWAVTLASLAIGGVGLAWARLRRHPPTGRRGGVLAAGVAGLLAGGLALAVGAASASEASVVVPGSPDFGDIALAGVRLEAPDARCRLPVTLVWYTRTRVPGDYTVALRLLDESGAVVGRRDKQPQGGLRPTRLWEAGQVTRDHQELALDPGRAGGGSYTLAIALRDARGRWVQPTGDTLPVTWVEPDGTVVAGIAGGSATVPACARPELPPLPRPVGAVIGDRIRLESVGLAPSYKAVAPAQVAPYDVVLAPGDSLDVAFRWVALGDVAADYAVFVHLLDVRQAMLAQDDEWPHRGFYPTSMWLPGERVADRLSLPIPADLPVGRYQVIAGMYQRSTMQRAAVSVGGQTADRVRLATVKVQPPASQPARPLDARLAGGIRLTGVDLAAWTPAAGKQPAALAPAPVVWKPGASVAVTMHWSAASTPREDYTAFVHVVGPDGRLVAQSDSQPSAGNYPTTSWEAGEAVPDRHVLALPPNAPAGTYRLVGGMYLLRTGERLPVEGGGDSVPLGEFVVGSGG